MSKVGIETSQHVQLNYNPAEVGDRIIAHFIDGVVIVAYYFIAFITFGYVHSAFQGTSVHWGSQEWILIAVLAIPVFFYHLIFEVVWNGKSIGKWMMGLQVVMLDGSSPSFGNYLIRWMLRLLEVSFTNGILAFITVLINGKGQRLGDIAAKTCVIKTRKKVKLSDTIYSEIEEDYEVTFEQVLTLSDEDITTIREVLASKKDYEYNTWFVMVQRTANIIQTKLGIQKADLKADDFLRKIIADYNHLHGS